jgi:hypothetical protein
MNRNPLVRITKFLLDFMFYSGIIICAAVPFLFKYAGRIYEDFITYYIPFCIIFILAGIFALIILWELRRMFHTVMTGDPFVKENVTSLKRMGLCAFIISVCMIARLFFVITPAAMILALVFLVAGLFSKVLSLVFDQAVTYKQENDLTI